jgi:hypothetical protein
LWSVIGLVAFMAYFWTNITSVWLDRLAGLVIVVLGGPLVWVWCLISICFYISKRLEKRSASILET